MLRKRPSKTKTTKERETIAEKEKLKTTITANNTRSMVAKHKAKKDTGTQHANINKTETKQCARAQNISKRPLVVTGLHPNAKSREPNFARGR